MERLQKVIANSGYCSRRKAEELINSGHVSINGEIAKIGCSVSGNDIIEIDGKMLNKDNDKVYFILNKPRGVICSSHDEKERKTVVDLIDTDKRIYPIGRLDYDTTGLLLLTNDGELTNYLEHPKNGVKKTYLARLKGIIDNDAISKLKTGVVVEGRKVNIVDFKIKKKDEKKDATYIMITIIEGRNHIVKKLFMTLGYLVDKLTRVSYDFLTIDDLKSGEYRMLSIKEVKKLYSNFKN